MLLGWILSILKIITWAPTIDNNSVCQQSIEGTLPLPKPYISWPYLDCRYFCCGCLVKFYWGQNKDCRLGDGPSDDSEKLLQRCRVARGQYIYLVLLKKEYI